MGERKTGQPEVLAPAGGRESLLAAVRCGADAVYFGATDFNARRNAENFSDGEFLEAVEYCRVRGVKVYVTLNTLVTDRERDRLLKTLRLIAESGADAVIVQDLGVASEVKRFCPSLPLHASTQTAVHNVSGAKELIKAGFERLVLARECSTSEIKKICAETGAETEIFVHGAHCMSVSGMCYMSSAFGGRSGNRGLCAQPCRLNFNADGREYALSLKDMSLIDRLEEITAAGVSSLKIEGRMKRPEYVAAAVTAVKKRLAGGEADEKTLRDVFSRSGFTDGYFTGHRDLSMFGSRTKDDVTAAAAVLPALRNLYKDERACVPVDMRLEMTQADSKLSVSDGVNAVEISGDIPQKALKAELSPELASRSLLKLGGTPYCCERVGCSLAAGYTLPVSSLNKMRREATEKLTELRARTDGHPFLSPEKTDILYRAPADTAAVRLRFEKLSQVPGETFLRSVGCAKIILPLREILKSSGLPDGIMRIACAEIPPFVGAGDEAETVRDLEKCRALGVKYALCENIGAVYMAKTANMLPVGGHMLNILNSAAAREYASLGVREITLSAEMSFAAMREFSSPVPFGFITYGHMPLMRFRCCPMQGKNGCGDCRGVRTLTDRRGDKMTVLCSDRRYSTLFNPVPLYTGNMRMPKSDFVTLYFTTETEEKCRAITELFMSRENAPFPKTSWMYDKELK